MTTLRQLAEAATPGPWETDDPYIVMSVQDGKIVYLANTADLDCDIYQTEHNAAYIAAANPTAILALFDTIDAQRKLLERAETVLSASYGDFYDEIFEVVVLNEITAHLEATK
jgi:Ead/Ea22-like protein